MTDHDYRRRQYATIRLLQASVDLQAVELSELRQHAEEQADTIAGLEDDVETYRIELIRQRSVAEFNETLAGRLVIQLEACRKDRRAALAREAAAKAGPITARGDSGPHPPTIGTDNAPAIGRPPLRDCGRLRAGIGQD